MIHINKILGNIKFDHALKSNHLEMLKSGSVENILLSRNESEKLRMRKVTDKGTEIALAMPAGSSLSDSDVVLLTSEKMVVAKRESESVAIVTVHYDTPDDNMLETAIKIGHTIGNLHRPVKIEGNKICFPFQAPSEIELFEKLFAKLRVSLDITVKPLRAHPGLC